MPILVQKIIFDAVPKRAPFLIRPILNRVFTQLKKLLVEPEIKKNLTMVCLYDQQGRISILMSLRSKHISKNQNLFFLQVDKSQLSVPN